MPMKDAGLIHLGLGVRYAEAEYGTFHFRERPEANTAPRYLDTGEFPAKKSRPLTLEFGTVNGGASFQGEYLKTKVTSTQAGDPEFTGWYLAGSSAARAVVTAPGNSLSAFQILI